MPVSFRAILVMVLGWTEPSRIISRSRLYSSRYIATKRVTPWRMPDRNESESPHHASTMIFTIDKSRVQRFLGRLTQDEMQEIEKGVVSSLDLNELFFKIKTVSI